MEVVGNANDGLEAVIKSQELKPDLILMDIQMSTMDGLEALAARGVLVNITAATNLKMKEVHEVMNTVKAFAAEDAHIIFGAVYDELMGMLGDLGL
jgi:cell division GTPase FtsZ